MKIVFWSPTNGQAGVTSNAMIIASLATLLYKKEYFLAENHFQDYSLRNSLFGKNGYSGTHGSDIFETHGVDTLLRYNKSSLLNKDIIKNCTISLFQQQLEYLPGSYIKDKDIYQNDMLPAFPHIINAISNCCDTIFVDTEAGDESLPLLNIADIIVVNLPQNMNVIDKILNSNQFSKENVFYLFGRYDKDSSYNIKNIQRNFKMIEQHKTAYIPYNTEFHDAYNDGDMMKFIEKNISCLKNDDNHNFMSECLKATDKLIKFMESTSKRKVG